MSLVYTKRFWLKIKTCVLGWIILNRPIIFNSHTAMFPSLIPVTAPLKNKKKSDSMILFQIFKKTGILWLLSQIWNRLASIWKVTYVTWIKRKVPSRSRPNLWRGSHYTMTMKISHTLMKFHLQLCMARQRLKERHSQYSQSRRSS